jgi:ppGpp synthetase/RelA/SpoT-type nucleotidyltranferase
MTAEDVRRQWLEEQSQFERFAEFAIPRLNEICERAGVWRRVSHRVKTIDSIVKKFIKAQREGKGLTLESMTDKLGMRVVVRFPREVDAVVEKVPDLFIVKKIEKKSEKLEPDQFGYQSSHLDVMLRANDSNIAPLQQLVAEVQVRTLSQDLWSEMAHDLSYKGVLRLPEPAQNLIDRRIYILSALVESADMDFSRIDDELHRIPNAFELLVLANLERHYYRFTTEDYDREFAIDSIRMLRPLYHGSSVSEISAITSDFVSQHVHKIQHVFERQTKNVDRSAFLYQPEIFLIFERLTYAPLELEHYWGSEFPPEELSRLQSVWGIPD